MVTIALAIVGLEIVSVLVSRNANTTGVIQAAASGFGSLAVAEAPVNRREYADHAGLSIIRLWRRNGL